MSEDAAWTTPLDIGYEECLPKIGLKVLDHIRFSPDTTDFTPIFNKIEGAKPDVIITGISHVGVQPTVQWKNQQVPIPMLGISSQATNSTFGKDTNDAAEGVLYQGVSGPCAGNARRACRSPKRLRRNSATSRPMPAIPLMTRSITSPTPSSAAVRPTPTSWSPPRKDRLGRHHRAHPVLRQGRRVHPLDQIRQGPDHRVDAAVAERRAGRGLAAGSGQGENEVPELHQGYGELSFTAIMLPGSTREHFYVMCFSQ